MNNINIFSMKKKKNQKIGKREKDLNFKKSFLKWYVNWRMFNHLKIYIEF